VQMLHFKPIKCYILNTFKIIVPSVEPPKQFLKYLDAFYL
jgi:hypothetical protein